MWPDFSIVLWDIKTECKRFITPLEDFKRIRSNVWVLQQSQAVTTSLTLSNQLILLFYTTFLSSLFHLTIDPFYITRNSVGTSLAAIGHHEKYNNTICLSPQILHYHCFCFLVGLTMVPRENKNNAYAKFVGLTKSIVVAYLPCAHRRLLSFTCED